MIKCVLLFLEPGDSLFHIDKFLAQIILSLRDTLLDAEDLILNLHYLVEYRSLAVDSSVRDPLADISRHACGIPELLVCFFRNSCQAFGLLPEERSAGNSEP